MLFSSGVAAAALPVGLISLDQTFIPLIGGLEDNKKPGSTSRALFVSHHSIPFTSTPVHHVRDQ